MKADILRWLRGAAAGLAGFLTWVFGPFDTVVKVLLGAVVLDYITGVIYAGVERRLNSEIGFRGLAKKVCIFALVALSAMLDKAIPATNGAIRSAVCGFYIANEGLSILENGGKLGLPLPESFKNMLEQLKNKEIKTDVSGDGKPPDAPAE